VVSRIQKKLDAVAKATLAHKEKGKLLKAELALAKREARREERHKQKEEERAYHSQESRLLLLAGVWLFGELRRGSGNAEALERHLVQTFAARAEEKDRAFVAEMLPVVLEKRSRKK